MLFVSLERELYSSWRGVLVLEVGLYRRSEAGGCKGNVRWARVSDRFNKVQPIRRYDRDDRYTSHEVNGP